MESTQPSLVEKGVKTFLAHTLKQCREYKDKHISLWYNLGFFFAFVIFIGGFLFYKYKGKLSPYEKEQKEREKKEYIISKLQQIALAKRREHNNLITNLPVWDKSVEVR